MLNLKIRFTFTEPCEAPNFKRESVALDVTSTTATTRKNEKSDKNKPASGLQRILPSLPGSENDSDPDAIVYESTSSPAKFGELAFDAEPRCDDAGAELCANNNSHEVDDSETKPQAFADVKNEDPERKSCPGKVSAFCYGVSLHTARPLLNVNQAERMTDSPSGSNEHDGVPEARMNYNEEAPYEIVNPIHGEDYVQTDLYCK